MKKMFVMGAVLAALAASPALGQSPAAYPPGIFQSPYSAYGAVTPFGSPSLDLRSPDHVSAARAAASRTCSGVASRYTEYTWGDMEFQQYRACTARPAKGIDLRPGCPPAPQQPGFATSGRPFPPPMIRVRTFSTLALMSRMSCSRTVVNSWSRMLMILAAPRACVRARWGARNP